MKQDVSFVVILVLLACFGGATAIKCYKCITTGGSWNFPNIEDGPCAVSGFSNTSGDVTTEDCPDSCQKARVMNADGTTKGYSRGCGSGRSLIGCRETENVTLCGCLDDFCNGEPFGVGVTTPVPPTTPTTPTTAGPSTTPSAPIPPIECYTCTETSVQPGPCMVEPFHGANVNISTCASGTCAIAKTLVRQDLNGTELDIYIVQRMCAAVHIDVDFCGRVPNGYNGTMCTCNTPLCNTGIPTATTPAPTMTSSLSTRTNTSVSPSTTNTNPATGPSTQPSVLSTGATGTASSIFTTNTNSAAGPSTQLSALSTGATGTASSIVHSVFGGVILSCAVSLLAYR